ncbi:MAG: SHOCT domain-containing protein [Cyanobacteria bacterium P01_A01_bin.105]
MTSSSPGTLPETLTDAQRWQVALLALAGALQPTPIPLTFLHKLYLRQYGWGMVYFLLGLTQIARVACAIEAVWYLLGAPSLPTRFNLRPSSTSTPTAATDLQARVTAIRALEQLRQDGLLSEYEFEQQRRQLLDG